MPTTDTSGHTLRLLVPIPESLHLLGDISRRTLYRLVDAGELTRVNIGRRTFITRDSIDAYIQRLAA